jgi:ribosome-interacting GTPase 1
MSESTVLKILAEYKIHHAELILREDCSVDQLIDALEAGAYARPLSSST